MSAILEVLRAEARAARRLGQEEEVALVRRWRVEADRGAADRLLRAHLRSVLAVVARYRRYGVPLSELAAEGAFGMVQALAKFDETRGIRFSTYANHWIRAYVLDHVIRSWSLVGGGTGALRSRNFFRIRRERARVFSLLGEGEEAERALGERLGVATEEARELVARLEARDVSLERPVGPGGSVRLLDLLEGSWDQERLFLEREQRTWAVAVVARALVGLDARERYIVERRLMADEADELSLAEISRYMGVSRERARQLETRAKKKLRVRLAALGLTPSAYELH